MRFSRPRSDMAMQLKNKSYDLACQAFPVHGSAHYELPAVLPEMFGKALMRRPTLHQDQGTGHRLITSRSQARHISHFRIMIMVRQDESCLFCFLACHVLGRRLYEESRRPRKAGYPSPVSVSTVLRFEFTENWCLSSDYMIRLLKSSFVYIYRSTSHA